MGMTFFKRQYKAYEADREGMLRSYPSLYEITEKSIGYKGVLKNAVKLLKKTVGKSFAKRA